MEFQDYYKTLGVARDATAEDVKKALRKLTRKFLLAAAKESDAVLRMRQLNEAYAVLSDAEDAFTSATPQLDWLTLAQVAATCTIEPEWLMQHVDEGLFPDAVSVAGVLRFSSASILRARRMLQMERDFDAIPELAALVADLLEEIDDVQARLRCTSRG